MIRSRPNWLLVTLIIVSVMIGEGVPLSMSYLMPTRSSWLTFLISTTTIALFGELIPQALVPMFSLEIGGRAFWFLRFLMWIFAVPACIPAYGLRRLRRWRGKMHSDKRDGILDVDEMREFIRLHIRSCGNGGSLTDECGSLVRAVLSGQCKTIAEYVRPWTYFTTLDVNEQLDAIVLANAWSRNDPYVLVVKNTITEIRAHVSEEDDLKDRDKSTKQDAQNNFMLCGILLSKVFE